MASFFSVDEAKERYALAQRLTRQAARRHRPWSNTELLALGGPDGPSLRTLRRLLSHYALFCAALGFDWHVFQLPVRELDRLQTRINWDRHAGRVRPGTNRKLGPQQARQLIRDLFGELNAAEESA